MNRLEQMSLHDSYINGIYINPKERLFEIELDYIDIENESFETVYKKAKLIIIEYQRLHLNIKGNRNREIILNMETKRRENPEGLTDLRIYTSSDSLIEVEFKSYNFIVDE